MKLETKLLQRKEEEKQIREEVGTEHWGLREYEVEKLAETISNRKQWVEDGEPAIFVWAQKLHRYVMHRQRNRQPPPRSFFLGPFCIN